MTMLTLALTCALLAGGGGPDDVVVECRADAEARGADVQLRDLAIVETDDPALAERLLQVSFGPRPAFGHNRVLSRQDVMLRLAREGIASDAMRLTGALQIVVHPLVTRVQECDLLEAADPVLRAAIRLEADDDIEFEPAASPSSLLVPPGRYSMELSAKLRGGALQHWSAIVDVAILVDANTAYALGDVLDELGRPPVAELDHLPELPGGVHVQKRERRLGRMKGLHRQVQHHRRILADGVQHDRVFGLGHDFPHDVNAFGFKPL